MARVCAPSAPLAPPSRLHHPCAGALLPVVIVTPQCFLLVSAPPALRTTRALLPALLPHVIISAVMHLPPFAPPVLCCTASVMLPAPPGPSPGSLARCPSAAVLPVCCLLCPSAALLCTSASAPSSVPALQRSVPDAPVPSLAFLPDSLPLPLVHCKILLASRAHSTAHMNHPPWAATRHPPQRARYSSPSPMSPAPSAPPAAAPSSSSSILGARKYLPQPHTRVTPGTSTGAAAASATQHRQATARLSLDEAHVRHLELHLRRARHAHQATCARVKLLACRAAAPCRGCCPDIASASAPCPAQPRPSLSPTWMGRSFVKVSTTVSDSAAALPKLTRKRMPKLSETGSCRSTIVCFSTCAPITRRPNDRGRRQRAR